MKKHNMFGVLVTTVLTATLALAAWPASGQDAHPGPAPSAAEAVFGGGPRQGSWKVAEDSVWIMRPGQKWDRIDLATVGSAVKTLTEIYPKATFAVDPRIAGKRVGDLIDRVNDPLSDLNALRVASGNAFDIRSGMNGLFMLEPNSSTLAAVSANAEDRTVECFNLTGYLQPMMTLEKEEQDKAKGRSNPMAAMFGQTRTGVAVQHLQEIIQRSIADLDSTLQQPRFQFYPDGGLLIVTGSKKAIFVAAKVINALSGQASRQETLMEQVLTPAQRAQKAARFPVPGSDPTDKP